MADPPAKFGMGGPCRAGGTHLIVPRRRTAKPFAGVACHICEKCKDMFLWVVNETMEERKEPKGNK